MRILQELLALSPLHEAVTTIELANVVKSFPNKHGEALQRLWGKSRLVWHGKKFFDEHGDLGPAYQDAITAAKHHIEHSAGAIENSIEFDGEIDGQEVSGTIDWESKIDSDMQECYLGFDPKNDTLIVGFDGWINEEDFNEAFDKQFKKETGIEYDMDNKEHEAIFNKVWKEYQEKKLGFYGVAYEVTFDGTEEDAEEALPPMAGGFYRGTRNLLKQQRKSLVDLRTA